MLMLGREVRAPLDLLCGVPEVEEEFYTTYEEFVAEKVERMRRSY